MRKTGYNPLLIIVILLAVVFSLFLNYQRHNVEQANRSVEMAVEYESVARMAYSEGLTEKEVLKMFKERGVTSLVLFDATLQKLNTKGLVHVATGSELRQAAAAHLLNEGIWLDLVKQGKILENAVYVSEGSSKQVFKDVEEDLMLRFGSALVHKLTDAPTIIEVKGDTRLISDEAYGEQRGVLQLDLGLSTEELSLAKELGFMVIARPVNYGHGYNKASASEKEQIDGFFRRLDQSGAEVSTVIGSGKTMLGYEENLDYVAEQLKKRNITLGMVENVVQLQFSPLDGLVKTAELMDYHVARTYVIDKAEQKKLKVTEALRRWALTDEERNIRINYIKTFLTPQDGKTLLNTNLDYVGDIKSNVEKRGFTIGRAGVFAPYFPQKVLYLPLIFGIVSAGVLYLLQLVDLSKKKQYLIIGTVGAVFCAGIFILHSVLFRQLLALGAATVFPVLAMTYIINRWDKSTKQYESIVYILWSAIWQLGLVITCSLLGASLVGAILGDIRFFLEIDIYKGVKLTFVLPIVLMFLVVLRRYSLFEGDNEQKNMLTRFNNFLSRPITLKIAAAALVLAFVAWVFIGRSGHTAGVPVPAWEIKLRLFLEELMYARPREKEFLVGHPAFFMAVFAFYRKMPNWFKALCVLGAVIGQGSLVQTFAHMRTPIIMSYIRALDGYF
ncbi:MAG TPA: hypothetical protein IAB06_07305, partial [Candidatus Avacidaminococcus intestinavium]|nr:hypothetical protein [Candidatus Avacidaminococcus intestinavium]